MCIDIYNVYRYLQSHTTNSVRSIAVWQLVSTSDIGHRKVNYRVT